MDQQMPNASTAAPASTPLAVFQSELSKFKNNQKRKKVVYVILPIVLVCIVLGGYFIYKNMQVQKARKAASDELVRTIQKNEEALMKQLSEGKTVPDTFVSSVNKTIEESKLNTKYGISTQELDQIKQTNQ